ncbi:MAG: primosomal protein N', partial [Firmicutes bacterium]|nr:primosomal protein N' [Bacillota bacterium]
KGIQKTEHQVLLTDEQRDVIETVLKTKSKFSPYLLHGVTGSGKTEVYMQLIEDVVKRGKEAIVLVPEISLTPQMVERFQNRFGEQVAILHSRLSAGEKYDEWRRIERQEVSIVIGARSAIFAPFLNLGMIIVDEEHSTTYKQENMPKYHAIDMALKRAKTYQCPIILGSATPSLESYTRAKLGVYQLLEMNHRVNDSFPEIIFVNMKDEIKAKHSVLSRLLIEKIKERLEKKEQVILLLNKRGYARVVTCKHCGYVDMCPNCDIPFIYHKETHSMQCHYCGMNKPILRKCPSCGEAEFQTFGMGTEKLEELVKSTFEGASVLRMDVDTTSRKGSHEKMIHDFESHKYDILIGTQMIAKGLDFENVTLVGVLEGDNSLNIPDFRSAERTFQLLNQVSGRAGRGNLKGEVVIQGFQLDHYSILSASKHDYIGFYNQEMNLRKKLNYPPFSNLTLIQLKGKDEKALLKEADKVKKFLSSEQDVMILGPSFASIPKINQVYTIQIILKYKKTDKLLKRLSFLIEQYATNKSCKLEVDMNPIRM